MNPTPPSQEKVRQAIFAGRKIEAIKLHRELTGLGLKDSKEAVEKLEAELRQSEPHRFEKAAAKGCFSVVLICLALAGVVLAAVGY